jgi:hypothetical protein
MPRKRVAAETPPKARKNQPKITPVPMPEGLLCAGQKLMRELAGPFVADDLDEEDDDGPDETATIET